MSVRMAADHVAAATQVADFGRAEERPRSEQAGDDEEVTPVAASAQLVAHCERAAPAVVERQTHMPARRREVERRHEGGRHAGRRDAVEVAAERRRSEGERPGGRPLEARPGGVVRYFVVVEARQLRHQRDSGMVAAATAAGRGPWRSVRRAKYCDTTPGTRRMRPPRRITRWLNSSS